MEAIGTHVHFWIGERTIHNLLLYVFGYEQALQVHQIEERDCPPVGAFHELARGNAVHSAGSRIARRVPGRARGDNELALENFFKLFAEFGRFRVVLGEFVDIPTGHVPTTPFGSMQRVPTRIQLAYLEPGTHTS